MQVDPNNSPDNVINQLMNLDAQAMKGSVELKRTGAFQSRTVTVGGQACSVKQLINVLGEKIKQADVEKDDPDLEKLKAMLTAVSEAEKEGRGFTSSLHHLFSSRDKDVAKLDRTVTTKIEQHHVFKALEGGVDVVIKEVTPQFRSLLTGLYAGGKVINDDMRETRPPIYIDINSENPAYSYAKSEDKLEIQFYMRVDSPTGVAPAYRMVLKNPVMDGEREVTTQEVVDYLARIGTKAEQEI